MRKKIADHARRTEGQGRIDAMIALARSEPGIPVLPREPSTPTRCCSPARTGPLNLKGGQLQEAQPADLLTRGTDVPYDRAAMCPRWEAWLAEVFDGDQEQIAFVKRAVGYSLTGFTDEQVLFVLFGTGCNGKSTLIAKLKRILGDLAVTAAFDSFARSRGDRGPREDLARLHGARLVVAAESGEGRQLDEATVKSLTGGDTVTARHLYRDHFEFVPAFKLWLVTNHRPRVDGDDDAIWRRPAEGSFPRSAPYLRDEHGGGRRADQDVAGVDGPLEHPDDTDLRGLPTQRARSRVGSTRIHGRSSSWS